MLSGCFISKSFNVVLWYYYYIMSEFNASGTFQYETISLMAYHFRFVPFKDEGSIFDIDGVFLGVQ